MPDLAWIEGEILPLAEAKVSFWDHGYFYGYAVYEACKAFNGRIYALTEHMARLERSLQALGIRPAQSPDELVHSLELMATRSGYAETLLYLQISKGKGPRGAVLPDPRPVVTMFAIEMRSLPEDIWQKGGAAITLPDERWAHPHIKTTNLLPNILAKEKADALGAAEAIFYKKHPLSAQSAELSEVITEAASSNVFAVLADGRFVTAPLDGSILEGVTRLLILRRCQENNIELHECYFTLEELKKAREIFICSTGPEVMPITKLDGVPVGDGKPGEITRRLYDIFLGELQNWGFS
jgi:D-alanine transaminase